MTLQRKLALTLALAAIPIVAGLAWVRVEVGRRADVQALGDLLTERVNAVGRQRCEATPELFFEPRQGPFGPGRRERPEGERPRFPLPSREPFGGGPPFPPRFSGPTRPGTPGGFGGRRPFQIFVYDAAFTAHVPSAPSFPAELRAALARGDRIASTRARVDAPHVPDAPQFPLEVLTVALKTEWADGPCAFVLAQRTGVPSTLASVDQVVSTAPLVLGLIAVMWFASGPLVRRVRTLTDAVKRSSASHYEISVPEVGSDEITALARAFNEAGTEVRAHLAQLEQRDRTLRQFLANTTHDVMIPLTVLQGHLTALRDSATGASAAQASLVGAVQEAHYMASLLHNLGAAAKLEAPDQLIQRHPVDLNALVERVVERHRPVAAPAGVSIEYAVPDLPIVCEGDVTLLEQAVSNIVHNAVRYNRAGGHVAVVLDRLGDDTGHFSLRVLDDGPGVPDEKLERLTERRYRDEQARQREPNGLGLGLAIAREVAERHGLVLHLRRSEAGGLEVELRTTAGAPCTT